MSDKCRLYEDQGRSAVENLKNSSLYFRKAPQSATFLVDDRQEKSIEISLRNFYHILKRLVGSGSDIDENSEDWIIDAANIFLKERGC
jgi:hypothetical protein